MPTYVYETVPEKANQHPTQFEVVQRMTDDALTEHPDTGEPVRRIISGGISLPVSSKGGTAVTVTAPAAKEIHPAASRLFEHIQPNRLTVFFP